MNKALAIHSLLDKSSQIKRNRENELKISGENFNVFSVLQLEYNEARLHSRLLADLLDPKGAHGQKTLFLRKFLEKVNLPGLDTAHIASARVYAEEYIGPIPADYSKGGLIDIVIKIPHGQVIVIENKINAGDQKHQLIRYQRAYRHGYLLYLTKGGGKPSAFSTHWEGKEMVVDFTGAHPRHICISYKEHILEWLEACYQEITRQPLLRETLFQYIATIKKITNQTTDQTMSNEIAEAIISTNAHLDGFFTLRDKNIVKAVERRLLYKFIDEMEIVAKDLGLVYEKSELNRELFGHKEYDTELVFRVPRSPFAIEIGFDEWRMKFFIGLAAQDPIRDKEGVELKQKITTHLGDLLGVGTDHESYYYLLYFKDSKHGDEYLHDWLEGSFKIWGAVNDGSVAKKMRWYLETILKELRALNLICDTLHSADC